MSPNLIQHLNVYGEWIIRNALENWRGIASRKDWQMIRAGIVQISQRKIRKMQISNRVYD